jgi:hypothetical protein
MSTTKKNTKSTTTTTKMTLSKEHQGFIDTYVSTVTEDYPEANTDEEQTAIDDMKTMLSDAMTAVGLHVLKDLPAPAASADPSLAEILAQVKELSKKIPSKPDQPAAEPAVKKLAVATSGKKGTHNVSAYTMWARNWRDEHPKETLPAGLWKEQCDADSDLKTFFQERADEFNQVEGRVSTKGSTRSSTGKVAGYTLMQKHMKVLNLLLPSEITRMKCSDPEFKNCQVLGKDGKVVAEPSIDKLNEWFQTEYGVGIAE